MTDKLPEDIYEEIDATKDSDKTFNSFKPSENIKSGKYQTLPKSAEETKVKPSKKNFVTRIILIIAVALLVFAIAFSVWQYYLGDDQTVLDTSGEVNTNLVANDEEDDTQTGLLDTNSSVKDKDRDGIPDVDEKEFGTDPSSPDSDNDGLFDYDEIIVFQTDPNDKDTDNDGYEDGAEIDAGYNPKGEGKLLNFIEELNKLNN